MLTGPATHFQTGDTQGVSTGLGSWQASRLLQNFLIFMRMRKSSCVLGYNDFEFF
jgi:hypothetical protein